MEEDLAVLAEEDESSEEEQDVVLRSRPGHWTAESQDLGQAIPVSFPNVHQGEYLQYLRIIIRDFAISHQKQYSSTVCSAVFRETTYLYF